MDFGIALMGLNGAGKSTIAHSLATHLGFFEMDVEDYYFPEQKTSRKEAVQGIYYEHKDHNNGLPFSNPRTRTSVETALLEDIKEHSGFVIAGVTMNWEKEILDAIKIAFIIETPLEVRLKRIRNRETQRFGDRVLQGGDMFDQQCEFRRIVADKSESVVNESARKLLCPVIRLNGTGTPDDNVKRILLEISTMLS